MSDPKDTVRAEFEAWWLTADDHDSWEGWQAAHAAQQERVRVLTEALEKWLGPEDNPNAGWHGSGGTHEVYACEYCNAKHGDCTQIPHSPTCPIPFARSALSIKEKTE